MEKIDFRTPDWENAQRVFDFFKQETTCMDRFGKLTVCPRYVVAIDDDAISACYAVYIANLTYKQYHVKPTILCVGGTGMYSKYINRTKDGTVLSEGHKLSMVVHQLGSFYTTVLSNGNNTGANLKEIIDHLALYDAAREPIIFCLTQRLSKRIERTVAYSTKQFPNTYPLNAYYYVPGETLQEMCQMYNGRAIAEGLPLLSEAAALYDRMNRYAGRYMAEMDKRMEKDVVKAGEELVNKYPIRVSRLPITAPLQFCKVYFGVKKHRQEIAADIQRKIEEWKKLV